MGERDGVGAMGDRTVAEGERESGRMNANRNKSMWVVE